MATAIEQFRSVTGDADNREVGYIVKDATDDQDAIDFVRSIAPSNIDNMPLDNIAIDEVKWPATWECTAIYSRRSYKAPPTNADEFQFELSQTSQRIYQSRGTIQARIPGAGPAGDGDTDRFHQLINVDQNGNAQGADIRRAVSSFAVRFFAPWSLVTQPYQVAVQYLVGKVNSLPFRGFAAGEVMFVGANGSIRSDETDWEITYRFEVSQNQTNLTIGPITGINVKGWEYLWVKYEQQQEGGPNPEVYVPTPIQVNVEQVYETGDLNYLFTG